MSTHLTGFKVFFQVFCIILYWQFCIGNFVLAKLATSNIRVKSLFIHSFTSSIRVKRSSQQGIHAAIRLRQGTDASTCNYPAGNHFNQDPKVRQPLPSLSLSPCISRTPISWEYEASQRKGHAYTIYCI